MAEGVHKRWMRGITRLWFQELFQKRGLLQMTWRDFRALFCPNVG